MFVAPGLRVRRLCQFRPTQARDSSGRKTSKRISSRILKLLGRRKSHPRIVVRGLITMGASLLIHIRTASGMDLGINCPAAAQESGIATPRALLPILHLDKSGRQKFYFFLLPILVGESIRVLWKNPRW